MGDTVPNSFKSIDARSKLDLRVLPSALVAHLDTCLGSSQLYNAGAHNEYPSFASMKNEYEIPDAIWQSLKNIMHSSNSIANKLKRVDSLKPCNINERTQKEVYRHILSMHLYKAHLFSDGQIKNYSEEDYKVKFWSFILEEFFGSSSVVISV
ncbi:uncharacterized protein RHIMIDRAFT_245634 [Rhizopus microsporus ATCC 52813]|uniref:Uncharacterized protein n=1 Tax=Rhizopus microsporus ATCC 52813 TaxID=1340429 RepID=A0A2G4SMD6_RHIZD|nr:uncharacterized protein RHIMIDRAFT_245634 [Rhizopus microsporus ATCC 52813]PHZ09929.1 hypothetical protein RHIMIDRAFT_245634 [Rhizopus microsporus ATCC 52813]